MEIQGFSKSFLFDKKYFLLRHLLFWSFIYLDEITGLLGLSSHFHFDWVLACSFLLDLFLVYFNIYYLIPRFLLKGKVLVYAVATLAQLLFVVYINDIVSEYFFPLTEEEWEEVDVLFSYLHHFLLQLGVLFPAIAIKLIKHNWSNVETLKELNRMQYDSELDKLKKQVNPHFLFNSLNAIYIQAKQKSDKVPASIMALSELMRYQTYDSQQKKVQLVKELEFLMNYLEMEKMRRENFDYNIDFNTSIQNVKIEPLLILPLVENACKYSQQIDSNANPSQVNLKLRFTEGNLSVSIENNIGNAVQAAQDKYSGNGQSNVLKRLKLLYPKKHTFKVQSAETDSYKVILTISTD